TIVGESGSGKSTLLEMLYGFSPDRGLVLIDEIPKSDVDMRAYREGVAVANQFYAVESASFFENVISEQTPFDKAVFEEVVREHGFESWLRKVSGADDSEPLDTLVRRVVLNRDATLSGGERKRFGMMAIDYRMRVAPDTIKMILLDEPTFGADQMLKPVIFSMIARWREEHPDKTIVVVNHDPAFFDYLSDDSRVLGIEKDGTLSQNETLASAREHKNRPFHQVFVKAKSASSS
ncbi:MAG: Thiol reductant ABC exporter, CydD subunit, partial [Candidatus Uhrbacteria bacterium GW2011_GWC2_53_7]